MKAIPLAIWGRKWRMASWSMARATITRPGSGTSGMAGLALGGLAGGRVGRPGTIGASITDLAGVAASAHSAGGAATRRGPGGAPTGIGTMRAAVRLGDGVTRQTQPVISMPGKVPAAALAPARWRARRSRRVRARIQLTHRRRGGWSTRKWAERLPQFADTGGEAFLGQPCTGIPLFELQRRQECARIRRTALLQPRGCRRLAGRLARKCRCWPFLPWRLREGRGGHGGGGGGGHGGGGGGATGKAPAARLDFKRDFKLYEIMRLMKHKLIKAARVILCLLALVVSQGCTTPQNRESGKSWSQAGCEEEQAQRLSESPEDEWNILP